MKPATDLPLWISLGGGCRVAYQLRRRHLRGASMPFDWIRTPPAALPELVASDLRGFLTAGDLWLQGSPLRILRERRYGIVLPHDADAFLRGGPAALQARFAPKIEAFRQALGSGRPLVLIRRGIAHPAARTLNDALLRRLGPGRHTLVAVDDRHTGPRRVQLTDDILTIATPSGQGSWSGCDHAWDWILDTVMEHLLRHSLRKTLPRRLLGREWLQTEMTLETVRHRKAEALDQIPEVLHRALIAGEDHRYLRHRGVDPIASGRALLGLLTRRPRGGGSTIEQQLYRTITQRRERTLRRKAREMLGATFIARRLDKNTCAALYLVLAYFGAHMNGVEQACATLGIPLASIGEEQAIALVARLKYPQTRDLGPRRIAQIYRRSAWIRDRMSILGE